MINMFNLSTIYIFIHVIGCVGMGPSVNREKERDIMHTAKSKQGYPYGKTEQVRQFKLDKK
jgi:hypothetical protein